MLSRGYNMLPLYYADLNKASKYAVQSVLIPRSKFSLTAARRWIASHDYEVTKPPDVTEQYYRFRQQDPEGFSRLRTLALGSGIKLIVGYRGGAG